MSRESILERCRRNVKEQFPMPVLDDIKALEYDDPWGSFLEISRSMGCNVLECEPGESLDDVIRKAYPDAVDICSNVEGVTIANMNPDTLLNPSALNGVDAGVVPGVFGVAENGCIWVPQTMKNKAVCFISENLVILVPKGQAVSNMHQAYKKIAFNDYGYGAFISGPSKTADIAQVLVMGAQAARSVTIIVTE